MSSLQIDPKGFRDEPRLERSSAGIAKAQLRESHSPRDRAAGGVVWPTWFKFVAPVLMAILFLLCVALWQRLAPEGWRISELWGFFVGDLEAAKIKAFEKDKVRFEARLKELEAKLIREQADANARVAEVTKTAESRAQQEILRAQAEKEMCVTQVAAAFDMIKTISAQSMDASTAMARSYLDQEIAKTGGQVGVANLLSMFSAGAMAFGREDLASQLEAHRQMIASQSAQTVRSAIDDSARIIAANQAAFLKTLPDAETLLKGAGCRVHPDAQRPADRPLQEWPGAPAKPAS